MRAALLVVMFASAFARPAAAAECVASEACVDAEPLWLSPAASRFVGVSDGAVPKPREFALSLTAGFRLRPAVATVPAPNREGREINLLRHATAASLGARLGLGNRLELTLLLPAGLYQRGAGIKGITNQAAPAIPPASLHDPRLGFGFALFGREHFGAKLRFDAKLPLGSHTALARDRSFVASPSVALSANWGGFFAGAELGARLRRPVDLLGLRIGSQALLAAGAGYELRGPRLSLALELYLLPSLIASEQRHLPAEWLGTLRWAPRSLGRLAFTCGAGSGLPTSGDARASLAFGVPSFRAVAAISLRHD